MAKTDVGDINAPKLLAELKKLQKENPGIRIGTLLQAAIDTKKKRMNVDFSEVSTKELLTSVKEYRQLRKENAVKLPDGKK